MRNIIKSRSLFSGDGSELYCFPDIFKGAGMVDETDPKEDRTSFQRIYSDVVSGPPGESACGSFRKAGFSCDADERKILKEMVLESQQKEAKAYQKGIQDGYREGRKAGIAEGLKEVETLLNSLRQAVQDTEKLRRELCLKAEKETVRLSLAIAGKILLHEPATDPDVVAGVVKKAFETIAVNAPVRIRINPRELAYMQERRQLIPVEGDVTFIEDASISCGGCVVESFSGDVDARIESQLEVIADAFMPGLEKTDQELEALS